MMKKIKSITLPALFLAFVIIPSQWLWALPKDFVRPLIDNQVYCGKLPSREDEVRLLSDYSITCIVHLQQTCLSSISQLLKDNNIKDEALNINTNNNNSPDPAVLMPSVKKIGELRARGEVVYLAEPGSNPVLQGTFKHLEKLVYFRHRACYRIDNNAGKVAAKIKEEVQNKLSGEEYRSLLNTLLENKESLYNSGMCDSKEEYLAEEGYVLKEHAAPFFAVSNRYAVAIGIRNAGHYTLKWTANGNPRKGHGILQKSIKPKSLEKYKKSKDYDPAKIKDLFSKGVFGLVGDWRWFRIDEKDFPDRVFTAKIINKNTGDLAKFYNEHDPDKKQELFEPLGMVLSPGATFDLGYTGDYDLQELIRINYVSSSNNKHNFKIHRLLNHSDSESNKIFEMYNTDDANGNRFRPDEPQSNEPLLSDAYVLRQLNVSLKQWGVSEPLQKHRDTIGAACPVQHWSLIQHGAQQNYLWSYKSEKLHEDLIAILLNPDIEIALVLPDDASRIHPSMMKTMLIFREGSELNLFYKMIDLMPWWELKLNEDTFNEQGVKPVSGKKIQKPEGKDREFRTRLKGDERKKYSFTKNELLIINKAYEDAQIKASDQQLAEPYNYE